ncbi:uncharacterized protein MONOS_18247 [Monocercomonoides exilis]|uniref:uncharacterized protein n=1 Tax=Monocercomonoides exilis TaxID=2049356 RepID=UPI003559E597|nr:hypothetical protein MONOS_18247 [Monocercomonoides exilis]
MLWRVKGGQVTGVRGICWGMLVGGWQRPQGKERVRRAMCWAYGWAGPVAWPGSIPHTLNSGVGARAPETKVTVCAQTVAARWAGCCWAPVYPSGWVADVGRVSVWAVATRLGGGSVAGLAGWAVG